MVFIPPCFYEVLFIYLETSVLAVKLSVDVRFQALYINYYQLMLFFKLIFNKFATDRYTLF